MIYDLQKASMWKRISAWLFDGILVSILVVAVAFLLSTLLGYDRHSDAVADAYARYEAEYSITFDVTEEEYNSWDEETRGRYAAAYAALTADEDAMYSYNLAVNLTMVIASLSILVAVAALEFVVPLLLKNGQTLGKKIFGLCVVRSDGVRINSVQLFARTVLGKFAIETMIPVYVLLMLFWSLTDLTGTLLLLALVVAELVCLIATRSNQALHDLLAGTAVADFSSQTIFASTEELIECQKRVAADRANRADY